MQKNNYILMRDIEHILTELVNALENDILV